MNKILSFIAVGLMAFAGSVSAQGYDYQYQRDANTRQVFGRVVSIGRPIIDIVPIGRHCRGRYDRYDRYDGGYEQRRNHSSLNGGTVLGAIVGGAVGSQVGDGSGRDLAMIAGGAIGATVGNDMNRRNRDRYEEPRGRHRGRDCEMQYDRRIVGYNYIAEYRGIRAHGQMNRRPYLGMSVPMLVEVRDYSGY
jgi:uncharacterized protein YcfJ